MLFVVILAALGTVAYLVVDEPLPQGETGSKAENLADKMLQAVNDSAWQATDVVSWNFKGMHDFVWDKDRHYTKVSWDDYEVYVDLNDKTGVAFVKSKQVKDSSANAEFVNKAYGFWVNDSFWLNPITKIKDAGTSRSFVELKEPDQQGLLVTYNSGGLTPGDSYLWIIDTENYRPSAVKMWVNIIPVGGIEFSWEEYVRTETGAVVAIMHEGLLNIEINQLKTYPSMADFENGDIFEVLRKK